MSRFRATSIRILHGQLASEAKRWSKPETPPSLSAYLVGYGLFHMFIAGRDTEAREQLLDIKYVHAVQHSRFAHVLPASWLQLREHLAGDAYANALKVFLLHEQDDSIRKQAAISILDLCVEAGWVMAGNCVAALVNDLLIRRGDDNKFELDFLSFQVRLAVMEGNLAVAERFERQLQSRAELSLGRLHPITIRSLNNLANVLELKESLEEAASLFREGLERTVPEPPSSPVVFSLKSGLASVLLKLGKHQEAETLLRDAWASAGNGRSLRLVHGLAANHNLATLHEKRGDNDKAYSLRKHVVDTAHRLLGPTHPTTLAARGALGCFFHRVRQLEDAEVVLRTALRNARETLGSEHWITVPMINALASVLQDMRRLSEAEELYCEVIAIGERTLGCTHPTTLTAKNNLATLRADQCDWEAATLLNKQILDARMVALGPDNPATINTRIDLSRALLKQGKQQAAETHLVAAYQSILRTHGRGTHVPIGVIAATASGLKKLGRLTESDELKYRFGRKEEPPCHASDRPS